MILTLTGEGVQTSVQLADKNKTQTKTGICTQTYSFIDQRPIRAQRMSRPTCARWNIPTCHKITLLQLEFCFEI